ncbi:MAG: NifU family protein [Bacteroidota bacterium]
MQVESPPPQVSPEAILFERLATEVDAALEQCRVLDDDGRKASMRLKKALEGFQKHVLAQLIRGLKDDLRGKELLIGLLDDPAILSAFTVHGLLKPDLNARVAEVVEGIRDYAKSHGGDVEFVRVEGDVAFVRMKGNCSGCSLSAFTLKRGVEDRLKEEVPEISKIEVLPTEPGAGIELESDPEAVGWVAGPPFVTMRHGEPQRMEGEGYDVLLVRYDEKVYAYRNACAHMGAPLHDGLRDGEWLSCRLHGFKYDLTSGECISVPQAQLEPFPLRVDDDGVVMVLPQ